MRCPACDSENPPGARTCGSCGQPLPAAAEADLLTTGVVCPKCDTFNEITARQCVRCGEPLAAITDLIPAVAGGASPAGEKTVVEKATRPDLASPPAGQPPGNAFTPVARPRRATDSLPAVTAAGPANVQRCRHCGAQLGGGQAETCPACGRRLSTRPQAITQPEEASLRLRLIRGFGQEDATWPIGPAGVTVGRNAALINIEADPYLSPVHFRLANNNGQLPLQDFGGRNGTFLRARGKSLVRQGMEFIVGRQRLTVIGLGGPTTDRRLPGTGSSRIFGSPAGNHLYVALRTLHAAADGSVQAAPVLLRAGPVITLGREGCDLNFPDDGRLAARHAEIHVKAAGLEILATGSTGVFVRLQGEQPLQNGDEIMAGEELFRVEID